MLLELADGGLLLSCSDREVGATQTRLCSLLMLHRPPAFLGLGAQPPTAEWGLMLSDGRKYLRVAWWLCVIPGVAIAATMLAINLLRDGVRDALDPHLRTRVD